MENPTPNSSQVSIDLNTVSKVSAFIAALALTLCTMASIAFVYSNNVSLGASRRLANARYEPGSMEGLLDGFAMLQSGAISALAYGLGLLGGGSLSLVGFLLGVVSVFRKDNTAAVFGIVMSLAGPIVLVVCMWYL